ncbi:hypothetical protein ACFLU6_07455 [Acidobacteriota bacterium]
MSAETKTGAYIAGFFFILYLVTAGGHFYSGDGATMYAVARSIVLHGTTAVEGGYSLEGVDGCTYAKYGLGQSLTALPLFAIGYYVGEMIGDLGTPLSQLAVSLFNVPVSALICVLVFMAGLELGYPRSTASSLALLYGTATLAWPYSGYFFSHPLNGLCILGAVLLSIRYRSRPSLLALAGASFLLGYSALTRPIFVFVFPLVLLYLFDRRPGRWPRKAVTWPALFGPFSVFIAAICVYNYARFRNLFQFGYEGEGFTTPLLSGLAVLLVHPAKSFLLYNPPALLGLPALLLLSRKHRRESMLFIALFLAILLIHAKWHLPEGGLCWGPRLLFEAVPFVILPLGMLWKNRTFKGALIVLWIAGVGMQIPGALAFYKKSNPQSFLDTGMLWGNIRQILEGQIDSFVVRHLGLWTAILAIPLLAVLLVRIRKLS